MLRSTRLLLASAALAAVLAGSGTAEAQSRSSRFGLGGMVGDPIGLSMKLRLNDKIAIDFGAGWEAWGYGYSDDSFQIHADFIWSIDLVAMQRADMSFYFGVGPQFQFDDDNDRREEFDDAHFWFGPRVPLGLVWDFKRRPLDVFFEIAPGILIGDHDHDADDDIDVFFEMDVAAGARFWF